MPSLSDHHSSSTVKFLFIGDSSTGKTGALTSLVKAGYKLRILDMDNGLDSLVQFVKHECPDKLASVNYETVPMDVVTMGVDGREKINNPKALVAATNALNKWNDGTVPAEWDAKDTIFVLDSLTFLGKAAYAWAVGMNPTTKDPRQWYGAAQKAVEHIVSKVCSGVFKPNVILISHINYMERDDGTTKGYASAIGKALGPTLATYFNTLILAESSGSGKNVNRRIKTVPTNMIDLKNPAPFKVEKELPLETGLATLFEQLKGQ